MSDERREAESPAAAGNGSHGKHQNLMSYAGWLVMVVAFSVGLVLLVTEAALGQGNPYTALVVYLVIPTIGIGGLALVIGGWLLDRRRAKAHRLNPMLPVVDLNKRGTRKILLMIVCAGGLFATVSSVATYKAINYTSANEFCGEVCHQVMQPEYEVWKTSPHAEVDCVACHVGPGVQDYVQAKASGTRQLWQVVSNTYDLPIHTPLAHLPDARETCGGCHWAGRYIGSLDREEWFFWYDEANTPSRYHLMVNVGGINKATGEPEGIHWHSDSTETVWYWPTDGSLEEIPWVELEKDDGTRVVYKSPEATARPAGVEGRAMDCRDCHNRPAHQYRTPADLVNGALAERVLDAKVPYIKRLSMEVLSIEYASTADVERRLPEEVATRFKTVAPEVRADIATTLLGLYQSSHFPDHGGTSWRSHPDNLGHTVTPGCFRCHDGEHRTEQGEVISNDCNLCHTFVDQVWGEDAFKPVTYREQPFEHPGGQADLHDGTLCTECHASDIAYPGRPADKPAP